MCSRTVNELWDYVIRDEFPSSMPVYADYFVSLYTQTNGDDTSNYLTTILGLYRGMIYRGWVTKDELHTACIENKLDDLIDTKYKDRESGYYKLYKQKGYKIHDRLKK